MENTEQIIKRILSEKRPTLSGIILADRHGFSSHWKFVDFICDYKPELVEELEEVGWRADESKYYLPKHQIIIEKHMGRPVFRSITTRKFANLYGYSEYKYLLNRLFTHDECFEELKLSGWDAHSKRTLIPLWIAIIVKHIGYPDSVETILRND